MNDLNSWLTNRFISWGQPNRWMLHEYDNHGATYGIELTYFPNSDTYCLRTYEESGYMNGDIIVPILDEKKVWRLTECFAPNNPNYAEPHR